MQKRKKATSFTTETESNKCDVIALWVGATVEYLSLQTSGCTGVIIICPIAIA